MDNQTVTLANGVTIPRPVIFTAPSFWQQTADGAHTCEVFVPPIVESQAPTWVIGGNRSRRWMILILCGSTEILSRPGRAPGRTARPVQPGIGVLPGDGLQHRGVTDRQLVWHQQRQQPGYGG